MDGVPRGRIVDAIFPSGPIGVIWIVHNRSTVKETDFGELPVWKYDASRDNFKLASKHLGLLLHSQASQSLEHAAVDELICGTESASDSLENAAISKSTCATGSTSNLEHADDEIPYVWPGDALRYEALRYRCWSERLVLRQTQ